MRAYEAAFGPRVSYGAVYDALLAFFAEGGARAYVGRVVGPDAVASELELVDRAGSPLPTLRIQAVNPGAWGDAVTVAVANGTDPNTFTITITYGDATETFANLASPAAAVTALEASAYVRGTNLGSATAAPNNNPAVLAATALTDGDDDRAAIVADDYVTAADALLGPSLGAGAVAVPGQPASAVGEGLLAHARLNNRIALLATASGQTESQAKAAAAALVGDEGSEFGGLFYPWIRIPAPGPSTRLVSPEGYVAGVRARAHELHGPWRAAAGDIATPNFVVGVERVIDASTGDELDAANVNVIRTIARAPRVYGWRSLSSDTENFSLLTARDVMNDVVVDALERMERYVFRNIDGKGQLFSELASELVGMVEPMRSAGGLYERVDAESGQLLDPGYAVDTGPSVNTEETIAAGEIRAQLSLRVAPVGTLVTIVISKAPLTTAL